MSEIEEVERLAMASGRLFVDVRAFRSRYGRASLLRVLAMKGVSVGTPVVPVQPPPPGDPDSPVERYLYMIQKHLDEMDHHKLELQIEIDGARFELRELRDEVRR